MWVRFLDKTSEGTLFNFGNPLREENPFGFALDTFVLSPESETGLGGNPIMEQVSGYGAVTGDRNPNGLLFEDTDTERFVRLVVYDEVETKTYDSHTAMTDIPKLDSSLPNNDERKTVVSFNFNLKPHNMQYLNFFLFYHIHQANHY